MFFFFILINIVDRSSSCASLAYLLFCTQIDLRVCGLTLLKISRGKSGYLVHFEHINAINHILSAWYGTPFRASQAVSARRFVRCKRAFGAEWRPQLRRMMTTSSCCMENPVLLEVPSGRSGLGNMVVSGDAPTILSQGIVLAKTGQFLSVLDVPSYRAPVSYSMVLALKRLTANAPIFVSAPQEATSAAATVSLYTGLDDPSALFVRVQDSDSVVSGLVPGVFVPETFVHIVVEIYDSKGRFRVYVNGVRKIEISSGDANMYARDQKRDTRIRSDGFLNKKATNIQVPMIFSYYRMALKELGENGVAEAYRLLAKNFKEAAKVDIGESDNKLDDESDNKLDDDVTLSPTMAGELILNPEVSIDSARATGNAIQNEGSGDMPATLHGSISVAKFFMNDDSGGATYDAMLSMDLSRHM